MSIRSTLKNYDESKSGGTDIRSTLTHYDEAKSGGTDIRSTLKRMAALRARVAAPKVDVKVVFPVGATYYPIKAQLGWHNNKFLRGYLTRDEITASLKDMENYVASLTKDLKFNRDLASGKVKNDDLLEGLKWMVHRAGMDYDVDGLNKYLDDQEGLLDVLRKGQVQEFYDLMEERGGGDIVGLPDRKKFRVGESPQGGLLLSDDRAFLASARSEFVEQIEGGNVTNVRYLKGIGVVIADKPALLTSAKTYGLMRAMGSAAVVQYEEEVLGLLRSTAQDFLVGKLTNLVDRLAEATHGEIPRDEIVEYVKTLSVPVSVKGSYSL